MFYSPSSFRISFKIALYLGYYRSIFVYDAVLTFFDLSCTRDFLVLCLQPAAHLLFQSDSHYSHANSAVYLQSSKAQKIFIFKSIVEDDKW